MKKALWEIQAVSVEILPAPTLDEIRAIFRNEFFEKAGNKLRPKRHTDSSGITVIATAENFDHIFMKDGIFQIDRAMRVHLVKKTIIESCHIVEDRMHKRRFHYLKPYRIGNVVEIFCVITKRSGRTSIIITAFPAEWERISTLLERI